ncbi:MAG: MoxR family ATPase [Chromatiales bacterium]|jgi:MoxR-like ATPase
MAESNDSYQAFYLTKQQLTEKIIGQDRLVERLLIALLADGHLLVEGPPGLAKTRAIKELSKLIEGDFHRLQFTPDLLPGDLTGTDIYRPQGGDFVFQQGPIFHNLVLADEINRAPAKVQSALLEAMEEKQVTVGQQTYALPSPFLVMATQNPIEQEGTYPLPEAQLDRFLMHIMVDYPQADTEIRILQLARKEAGAASNTKPDKTLLSKKMIEAAQAAVLQLHMAEPVQQYLVQLVLATRNPASYGNDLSHWVSFGASPRGSIALDRCARAHAWLSQRDYVSPEDVQAVFLDVLRHRVLLSYEAEAEGYSPDDFLYELLQRVPVV